MSGFMADPQGPGQASALSQDDDAAVLPPLPSLPQSGQEVFDQIMGQIEPELTSAGRAMLEEKYSNETAEARQARFQRYEAAFEEYDRRYAEYQLQQQGALRSFQRQAVIGLEEQAQAQEFSTTLSQVESDISRA